MCGGQCFRKSGIDGRFLHDLQLMDPDPRDKKDVKFLNQRVGLGNLVTGCQFSFSIICWRHVLSKFFSTDIGLPWKDYRFMHILLVWKYLIESRRRQWHPTPVLLPGKSHGWRSLVGCSPWGRSESDTTEWLHFHFSLSCIGEGNGKPLQCSCLENPRDRGAWWAAISGVAQSRTRVKWLSSSSRNRV